MNQYMSFRGQSPISDSDVSRILAQQAQPELAISPEQIALSIAQNGGLPQAQTPEQIAQQTAIQGAGTQAATPAAPKTFWEKAKDFATSPLGAKTLAGLTVGLGGMAFGGRPVEGLAYGLGAAGATADKIRELEVEDKKLENEEKRIDDNAMYRQLMLEQRQDLSNQKYQQALDILANKQSDPYNQARTARAQSEAQIYQLALAGDPNAQAYLSSMNAANPSTPVFPGVQERAFAGLPDLMGIR